MYLYELRIIIYLLKLILDVKDIFIMCVIEKMEKKIKRFLFYILLVLNYVIN